MPLHGSVPRVVWTHDNIITIRDTHSVDNMSNVLQSAKKVLLLGNGGIALELAHELNFCETEWVIRDAYIGSPFFDTTASDFLLNAEARYSSKQEKLGAKNSGVASHNNKNSAVVATDNQVVSTVNATFGSALGPHLRKKLAEIPHKHGEEPEPLHIHFEMQVVAIYDRLQGQWLHGLDGSADSSADLGAKTQQLAERDGENGVTYRFAVFIDSATQDNDKKRNGEIILDCDFVVTAVGVQPNSQGCDALQLDDDGSILVNETMQTSDPHVYAAGDCCNYQRSGWRAVEQGEGRDKSLKHNWMQMRLWAQARVMGLYAAQCINEGQYSLLPRGPSSRNDWAFEMFAHCTNFFGFKVVLLGRFNGQGLGRDSEAAIRTVHVSTSKLTESRNRDINQENREVSDNRHDKSSGIDFGQRKRGRFNAACVCCKDDPGANLGCLFSGLGPSRRKKGGNGVNTSGIEVAIRFSPGQEYIKLVLVRGRVVGALLIGETDLEETFENLILNRIDVGHLGSQLLDPEHDLEDYFD